MYYGRFGAAPVKSLVQMMRMRHKAAMSAYIEIDSNEIKISGMDGEFLSVTPDDIELHDYR